MVSLSSAMKILISACLLGQNVKYNGLNNSILDNQFIKRLQSLNLLIPICPEVDGGLSIPRVPVEIIKGRAIDKFGKDKTKHFQTGAKKAVILAKKFNIKYAVLKSKSPSCGSGFIYDGSFSHTLIQGDGITALALKKIGVQIFSEDNLDSLEKLVKLNGNL